jgi:glycine dehydrogenase subunit 1
VVDFSKSGRSVSQVNQALLNRGIFGGYDISRHFPEFKNHAIFCITEVHTLQDMDHLVQVLREVLA